MAPEILFGDPYGRRADIWALGCTILEIATGEQPWSEKLSNTNDQKNGGQLKIKSDLE